MQSNVASTTSNPEKILAISSKPVTKMEDTKPNKKNGTRPNQEKKNSQTSEHGGSTPQHQQPLKITTRANNKSLKRKRKRKRAKWVCNHTSCSVKFRNVNKHVLFVSNRCKCGLLFCGNHLSDHNCSFDHVQHHKTQLTQNNPLVVPKVIDRI